MNTELALESATIMSALYFTIALIIRAASAMANNREEDFTLTLVLAAVSWALLFYQIFT
jgi:hypothetical protein